MKTINWDVVWSTLRTLLVAGGPAGTLLIALGFPPLQVSTWLSIGLAVIGVASFVVPGIYGALKQTDAGKAAAIQSLSPEGKAAVMDKLPAETKLAAASALPDVTKIVVKDDAKNGTAKAAADPALPKVVPESAA